MKISTALRGAAASAAAATLVMSVLAPGTASAAEPPDRSSTPAAGVSAGMLDAMQRDLGLSRAGAEHRLVQEDRASRLNAELPARLGTAYAGSWFDSSSGLLTVAVTSGAAASTAKAAGAKAVIVSRNLATLDGIVTKLDALARRDAASTAGVAGWRVDPQRNAVVVTTVKGQRSAALLAAARASGTAVITEEIAAAPQTTARFLDGGEAIFMASGGRCSAGFNLKLGSTPRMLTAGHCSDGGSPVRGFDGNNLGNFVVTAWRDGNDYATTTVNTTNWIQGPWVSNWTPGDGVVVVYGSTPMPFGFSLCKSGSTTGWTCGIIVGLNESVVLSGVLVNQLTRHTACVERGDSGGSNVSGGHAQGVSSGAVLYGAGARCGANAGMPTISWFQPINEVLSTYGYTLITG